MTDYPTAREELRSAEVALMQQREEVATLRRKLPPGPVTDDYVFTSTDGEVHLTDLFTAPDRSLILYHFMFGKAQEQACPACSMWTDGWNAVADHLADKLDFAIVTAAPVAAMSEMVAARGWSNLRWLSAADNSFKADIGGEDRRRQPVGRSFRSGSSTTAAPA